MMPYYQDSHVQIFCGDCREILPGIGQVDLVLTDPPYGYSFMGKDWDRAVPSIEVWKECLRVLKPGGFAFVMCAPRQDCLGKMICNLSDAGFETGFTSIYWTYASGFPKAQDIGKGVDKRRGTHPDSSKEFAIYIKAKRLEHGIGLTRADEYVCGSTTNYSWFEGRPAGQRLPRLAEYERIKELLQLDNRYDDFIGEAEREVVGEGSAGLGKNQPAHQGGYKPEYNLTISATPQAQALDGSYAGFQPKPAVEVILVCMKPLSEKTYVEQALKNGKGVTWLDGGRIPMGGEYDPAKMQRQNSQAGIEGGGYKDDHEQSTYNAQGRFPGNLLVSDDVLDDGKERVSPSGQVRDVAPGWEGTGFGGARQSNVYIGDSGSFSRYFDLDRWWAERVKELPESVQQTFPFLIVPKASKAEKNRGCEDLPQQTGGSLQVAMSGDTRVGKRRSDGAVQRASFPQHHNYHPTVKPLKLMSYLITLGSREGDVILDPFVGSGTTCLAAQILGRKSIGIESEESFCEIAANRCRQMVMEF